MIKQTNTRHRNVLGVSFSLLAAAALYSPAQAGVVDPQILAARTAANSANIEDIGNIARTTADKFGTGEIKSSGLNIKSLAAFMADAIIAKQSANPPSSTDVNRIDNKADEVGEVTAFITDGVIANPSFLKFKKAKKRSLSILRGALNTAKQTVELTGSSVFRDVAGSFALTVHNDPGVDAIEAKLAKFLQKTKPAKSIAGKTNLAAIKLGLAEGFSGSPESNLKYEDGNVDGLTLVQDPETDLRPA